MFAELKMDEKFGRNLDKPASLCMQLTIFSALTNARTCREDIYDEDRILFEH